MEEDIQNNIMTGFSSGKVEFSKPLLVMLALKDCREKRAVEMKAGYFNEMFDKLGKKVRTWIPDSRKTFISSVISLRILLSPERDKKFNEAYKKNKGKEKKVFGKYAYKEKIMVEERKIEETGKLIMPQIDDSVLLLNPETKKHTLIRGGWNRYIDSYFSSLIPIYDRLLEELNNLVERTGYFKKKGKFG